MFWKGNLLDLKEGVSSSALRGHCMKAAPKFFWYFCLVLAARQLSQPSFPQTEHPRYCVALKRELCTKANAGADNASQVLHRGISWGASCCQLSIMNPTF
jgi:hypothetical protein